MIKFNSSFKVMGINTANNVYSITILKYIIQTIDSYFNEVDL